MSRYDGEPLLVGSRTVNELRCRFVGKTVRTSRILNVQEYNIWIGDAFGCFVNWDNGFDFGGEGVVVDVKRYDDIKVLQVDYGMQWPIDELTTIQVIDE